MKSHGKSLGDPTCHGSLEKIVVRASWAISITLDFPLALRRSNARLDNASHYRTGKIKGTGQLFGETE